MIAFGAVVVATAVIVVATRSTGSSPHLLLRATGRSIATVNESASVTFGEPCSVAQHFVAQIADDTGTPRLRPDGSTASVAFLGADQSAAFGGLILDCDLNANFSGWEDVDTGHPGVWNQLVAANGITLKTTLQEFRRLMPAATEIQSRPQVYQDGESGICFVFSTPGDDLFIIATNGRSTNIDCPTR